MFDRDMLNDLAKIKVNRKRKVDNIETQIINENKLKAIESDFFDTNEEDFEEIVYESEEDFEKSQALKSLLDDSEKNEKPKSNLENLANFMSGFSGNKSNQNQQQEEEAYEEDDYEDYDDEEEYQNQPQSVEYKEVDGSQINSRYVGEDGNINIIYGEPGKNVINRKSVETQRLDNKMGALAGLLTKFKSEDEIEAEESDPDVIMMDKEVIVNKNLKKMDTVIQIKDNLEIKLEFVKKAFKTVTDEIERKAKIPHIELDLTRADYLRALFTKKNIDDMDVARIFTLSLFLQNPEKFPTEDTYEQVVYLNSQIGAKCKSIDLKRMITYIASESEFNQTVDLVANIIKNPNFNAEGVSEVFGIKCKEVLKILMSKCLKNNSFDYMSKINILSIKQDIQMRTRSISSSISLLDSLNLKLKAIHPSLKEQLKKTEEKIIETTEKIEVSKIDLETIKKEITILVLLENARKLGGYNLEFVNNIPFDTIAKQLKEYDLDTEDFIIKDTILSVLKDETINNIIKS
ncbi:MAG: hypothetical protein AABZ74_02500 [Cyanobacteriota bacterium]